MEVKPQKNTIKEKILQDLGENPTEIDIRYIGYVTNIPTSQIKLWIEESQKNDCKIDIGSKECLIVGSRKPKGIKSVKIKIETPQNDINQTQNQQEEQKQINEQQIQDNINRQTQKESKINQKNQQIIKKQKLNQQVLEQVLQEPNKIAPIIQQDQNQINRQIDNKSLQTDINQEQKELNKNNHQKNQNNVTVQEEGQKQLYKTNDDQQVQNKKLFKPKFLIQTTIKQNNKNTNELQLQVPLVEQSNNIETTNQITLVQNNQIPTLDINNQQNEKDKEQDKLDNKNNKYILQKIRQDDQQQNKEISTNQLDDRNQIAKDLEQKIAYFLEQDDVRNNNNNNKNGIKKDQKLNQSSQIENNQKQHEIQLQHNNPLEQDFQPISISSSPSLKGHQQQQCQNQPQSNNIQQFISQPTFQDNKLNNSINNSKVQNKISQQQQNQTQNSLRQQNLELNKQNQFECQQSQYQYLNQDSRLTGQQQQYNQQDQPYRSQLPILTQAYQPNQQQYLQAPIINPIQSVYNQSLFQMPIQTQEQNYCQQYAFSDANSLQKLQQRLDIIFLQQNTHQLTLLSKLDQIINLIQRQQNKK